MNNKKEERILYFTTNKNNLKDHNEYFLLSPQGWNDWWMYENSYVLYYINNDKNINEEIGVLKIGQVNKETKIPEIPDIFESLNNNEFISLGQDADYYEQLKTLEEALRENVLKSLNDLAYNTQLVDEYSKKQVVTQSLMRDLNIRTVKGQFHRLATGGEKLTKYSFEYTFPNSVPDKTILNFSVVPNSFPPTNIHVIIGRNAVGKTTLFKNILSSISESKNEKNKKRYGEFKIKDTLFPWSRSFTNIVYLGFSVFEKMNIDNHKINYSYIGCYNDDNNELDTFDNLANQFVESMLVCLDNDFKFKRWKQMIEIINSDPILKDHQWIKKMIQVRNKKESTDKIKKNLKNRFMELSSGHKIVMLSITRLVETVEEGTLVLLDEPELHLHPPLLGSFMRAVSYLMINRNGVALVATHSPVILQEVPRKCVWILRRSGNCIAANRPRMECFGENVGVLTTEVFGVESSNSGYYQILKQALQSCNNNYEEAKKKFNGEIGLEGLSVLKILSMEADENESDE